MNTIRYLTTIIKISFWSIIMFATEVNKECVKAQLELAQAALDGLRADAIFKMLPGYSIMVARKEREIEELKIRLA
jgi:hypothetical protein